LLVKAIVEKLENDKAKIDIEIEASEFEQTVQKVYLKSKSGIALPGFRKGKAPRKVLERYYGEGMFHEDAFEMIFPRAYYRAISENGIKPAGEPTDLNVIQMGNGQDLKFSVQVQIEPKPELGRYKGVEIVKMSDKVNEEEVAHELSHLKEEHARWLIKEEAAALGDRVSINITCNIDNEPIEAISKESQFLSLGTDGYLPGFDANLIGLKADEQKQFDFTLPEDYAISEYAGKTVTFDVTVKEVKYCEFPELDDEFAKDVSEFDTISEFVESIKVKIQKGKTEQMEHDLQSRLLSKIADGSKLEIPANMIENRVSSMLHETEHRTQALFGKTLKELEEIKYFSLSEMKENYKKEAYADIKTELILDEIASIEGLQATDDEMEARLPKDFPVAWKNRELENDKDINYFEALKDALTRKKVIDFLLKNAVIIEGELNDSMENEGIEDRDLTLVTETEV